ncbi:MAG TPA: co-chaperone DjlA [Gammaproteobacteria bacterium]
MQWIGKAVGGAVGFVVASVVARPLSLLGLAVGIAFGHQYDDAVSSGRAASRRRGFGSERIQQHFFESTFAIMGHVAKSDGRVSEEDIRAARRIMHGMSLSPEQIQGAIAFFTAGKSPGFRLMEILNRLHDRLRGRRDLTRAFVEIQMQAALASGSISRAKREVLWEIARTLGMGRVELAQIEALIRAQQFRASGARAGRQSLGNAFSVLGLTPNASDDDIKTAYRRLMNEHHPDKLVAKGLPESMMKVAEEKTQEIRSAYERIKEHRGFK